MTCGRAAGATCEASRQAPIAAGAGWSGRSRPPARAWIHADGSSGRHDRSGNPTPGPIGQWWPKNQSSNSVHVIGIRHASLSRDGERQAAHRGAHRTFHMIAGNLGREGELDGATPGTFRAGFERDLVPFDLATGDDPL